MVVLVAGGDGVMARRKIAKITKLRRLETTGRTWRKALRTMVREFSLMPRTTLSNIYTMIPLRAGSSR